MSERNAQLHPDVAKVLALFEELNVPDFYKGSPNEARAIFAGLRPEADALPQVHRVEDATVPGPGTEVPVRIYRPDTDNNLPALVWIHGGGWVFGDLAAAEMAARDLCRFTGCVVISVDYRLAPEAPFPAAVDDSIAVTEWVFSQAQQLGIDPTRIAVGGDSAGGNLAAVVALHARDKAMTLAHQLLIYPVTEADFDSDSYQRNADGYFLSRASMRWFWDHYVPDLAQRTDPRVAPLHANLEGLASAWVLTCEFDPLCDDGRKYVNALQAANVDVQHWHMDDAIHGVFGMAIDRGEQARRAAADSLRAAFRQPI